MSDKIISIDVISDIVCPWCYIGRQRLTKAIHLLDHLDIIVNWKPFQLNPQMPITGKPYQQHMRDIKGSKDSVDADERTLIELGLEEEIEFDFESIQTAPNSLDAHRLIYWASQDKKETQGKIVKELFSRYFEKGQNIAENRILSDSAKAVGMHAHIIEKLLETDIDKDTIIKDCAIAHQIGVRGVPCFIMDRKFVVMGAQPVDVLADAIQQIADGFEPATSEDR